jgi:hypothetical protein
MQDGCADPFPVGAAEGGDFQVTTDDGRIKGRLGGWAELAVDRVSPKRQSRERLGRALYCRIEPY